MLNAITTGNASLLRSLIKENHDKINEMQGANQYTPLHTACFMQKLELVTILLEGGADPSLTTNSGDTALHKIVSAKESSIPISQRSKIIQLLIKYGVPVNAINLEGKSPIHIAASRGYTNTVIILSNQQGCNVKLEDKYVIITFVIFPLIF